MCMMWLASIELNSCSKTTILIYVNIISVQNFHIKNNLTIRETFILNQTTVVMVYNVGNVIITSYWMKYLFKIF